MKRTGTNVLIALAGGLFFTTAALAQGGGPRAVHQAVPNSKIVRSSPELNALIAPNAKLERVATGFDWTEGPMWHNGTLWFSDLSGNKMYSLSPNGKLKVLLNDAGGLKSFPAGDYGGSNAMVPYKNDTVLMNRHGKRDIVELNSKMQEKVFLSKYEGKQFNSPNDLVFAPDGALYFTDPPYGFYDAQNPNKDLDKDPRHVLPFNGVYRYKDGKLTAVIKNLPRPNGLAFSPDGKTFYVNNSVGPAVLYKYHVNADGSLSDRQVFADFTNVKGPGVPDGMKVDSRGDVWTSGPDGFYIYSPQGKLLGNIVFPEIASNLAWGGPDGKTAYFTAAKSIYKLQVKVKGELPLYH